MTFGSTRRTSYSWPTSARIRPRATPSAVPMGWRRKGSTATAAWPSSASTSRRPSPSKEPANTSPWISPTTKSPSLSSERWRGVAGPAARSQGRGRLGLPAQHRGPSMPPFPPPRSASLENRGRGNHCTRRIAPTAGGMETPGHGGALPAVLQASFLLRMS